MYRFRDTHGRVIYVGKAKSLRSRLTSYFADIANLHPRTRQMVTTAAKVEWMYRPSALNLWKPGFPEFLKFATLTCSPWRWVLVAPSKLAPEGFVNVQTGETHKVVWA